MRMYTARNPHLLLFFCDRKTNVKNALNKPFKDEAQTALFKDPVRTAQ